MRAMILDVPAWICFFNFIRADGVRLDYVELFTKYLDVTVTSFDVFENYWRWRAGYYIVHCSQDLVELWVTLVVGGPRHPVQIYDAYQEDKDPPCKLELLSQIEWLDKVYALYHVALPQPMRPKKPNKSKKKANKKSKLSRS
ncbi:hypothetical protein PHMEG_00035570 [Phytophthora megakarya]|uniref:Uncharacterized protein n=1 Tax=Phytophthora megakarya TaxID=4795 RepID=A0A225UNQ6_9STRA|nr:hypothetical protein PHMEG_00035570 [Phytophthora megakarya]